MRPDWNAFRNRFYAGGLQDANTAFWNAHHIYARPGLRGETKDLLGLYIVAAGSDWPGLNLAFISEPVSDAELLRDRIGRAKRFFGARRWILAACDDWMAPGIENAFDGVRLAFRATAMAAASLNAPEHPLPDLEYRPAADVRTRADLALVNAAAWNIPLAWPQAVVEDPAFWRAPVAAWVAYAANEPVATAMTFPVQGHQYVAWVATAPEHRRKGYAEAVVRHAIDPSQPTMLHSGPESVPLYRKLGYQPLAMFSMYLSADKTD